MVSTYLCLRSSIFKPGYQEIPKPPSGSFLIPFAGKQNFWQNETVGRDFEYGPQDRKILIDGGSSRMRYPRIG
jgi:hypothetical protein